LRKKIVFDAGIPALYFAGNKAVKKYVDDMYRGLIEIYMCEVNLAEFIYNYARVFGWDAALVKQRIIRDTINVVTVDEELTLEAAKLKLKYYNVLSLADCYLIALAKRIKARVITTDPGVRECKEVLVTLISI